MGKVIFNLDDLGYSRGVNYGIMDAYQRRILTSITLMVNVPGFEHAAKLRKGMPRLGVGVRLTLMCGRSLLKTAGILIKNGEFRSLSYRQHPFNIDKDQLYQEWNVQIQRTYHAGIISAHSDSCHYTHTLDKNQKVVVTLTKKYDLSVRNNFERKDEVRHVNYLEPRFDVVGETDEEKQQINASMEEYLASLFMILREDKTIEVMCHTTYLDQELLNDSSFVYPRTHQVEFLIHSAFTQKVESDPLIELVIHEDI